MHSALIVKGFDGRPGTALRAPGPICRNWDTGEVSESGNAGAEVDSDERTVPAAVQSAIEIEIEG